jgi:hypothetical protein
LVFSASDYCSPLQGLPAGFCNKYLPKHDTDIVLEDENGNNHNTNYLGGKQGLSAGWRGFAINHDIKVGDVVVFELVSTTKFKASVSEMLDNFLPNLLLLLDCSFIIFIHTHFLSSLVGSVFPNPTIQLPLVSSCLTFRCI